MNNKCIYLKQKFNRNLECKKDKNRIPFKDCKNCPYKEYKSNNSQIKRTTKNKHKEALNTVKLKNKSNKLAKLERERTSLFTDDLEHCIICGRKKEHMHEVFFGRNRKNSMKYKLCIPVCFECHSKMHSSIKLQELYHKKGQALFKETYPDLDFMDIFKEKFL